MKKILTISILLSLALIANPAFAYSQLAEDFLTISLQTDAPFPPEHWAIEDLHAAATEVLDAYESDDGEESAVYYCLIALGHAAYPEDIHRILEYEESMTGTVLWSLRGFSVPEAVECMLRWAGTETSERELAYQGLGTIDYNQLDEPDEWRERVTDQLLELRESESIDWLIEEIDETLAEIEANALEAEVLTD